jgi:hypothetical protein
VLKALSICGMFCFETGNVDISWHQLALLGILDIVLESKASFPRPAAAAHFPPTKPSEPLKQPSLKSRLTENGGWWGYLAFKSRNQTH